MKAVLVQEKWVDWPDPIADKVGNILLSRIMDADVRPDSAGFGIEFKDSWHEAIADVERAGGTQYAIPAGASDHELGVFFDTIVVCSVTGSTHAGMIAGFAGQRRPRRVIGIDASAKVDASQNEVIPGVLEQVTPVLRRLEFRRFSSLTGRQCIAQHKRITSLCRRGDAEGAAEAAQRNGRRCHF